MSVPACSNLSGKELHRQIGVEPRRCHGYTLIWNARDVGSSLALGAIFSIVFTLTTLIYYIYTLDIYICIYVYIYIFVCIGATLTITSVRSTSMSIPLKVKVSFRIRFWGYGYS